MAAGEAGPPVEPTGRVPDPPSARSTWDTAEFRLVVDFDGYYTRASPAYRALLGWSLEELTSAPYREFLHPDDQHRTVESNEQLMRGDHLMVDHDLRVLCRDGTYRWMRWAARSDARQELIYGIATDTTDDHPVEKRLLVGSWDWHIPSNTATWSDGMFEIYGMEAAAGFSYEAALECVDPADRAAVERAVRRSLANGEPYLAEHRILHPDKGIRWLHSAGRVLMDETANPEQLRGITMDVTDGAGKRTAG